MQIVIFILFLIGVGLFLGLAYVGIRALIMTARGSRDLTKTVGGGLRQGWQQAKAEAEAKKQERLRARS